MSDKPCNEVITVSNEISFLREQLKDIDGKLDVMSKELIEMKTKLCNSDERYMKRSEMRDIYESISELATIVREQQEIIKSLSDTVFKSESAFLSKYGSIIGIISGGVAVIIALMR
jgi:flagellar biosynthesis chaperone FliJ